MKLLFLSAFLFLFFISAIERDRCDCQLASTNPKTTYRWDAKHETDFSKYHKRNGVIEPAYVRSWEKKYKKTVKKTKKIQTRYKNTPEDSIYTMKGFIYYVNTQEDDCDLHIQIGPESNKALRAVAEIKKENCELQKEVLAKLKEKGFKFNIQNKVGIPVTIIGLGFYDGQHPLKRHQKMEKGNSWEIHPVISLQFD